MRSILLNTAIRELNKKLDLGNITERLRAAPVFWKFVLVAILASLLLVGPVVIYDSLREGLEFDGSYNLQTAKNVAQGEGYASDSPKLYEDVVVFDPYMTTGPTVIFPVALFIRIFGDASLAFLAFTGLVFMATGVLSAVFIYSLTKSWWALAVIPSLLLLRFIDRSLPVDIAPVGEFAAALCCIGAFVAHKYRQPYLLGALIMLAFLTKSIMLFLAISLIPIVLYDVLKRRRVYYWLKTALAALLLFVGWELYKLISLGGVGAYIENWKEYIDFFTKAGSGLYGGPVVHGVLPKIEALITGLSSPRVVVIVLAVVVTGLFAYILLARRQLALKSARMLLWPLLFICVYGAWWLFIADRAYVRHIVPLLVVIFCVCVSAGILCLGKVHKPILAIVTLIALSGVSMSMLRPVETQKLTTQQAVASKVKELPLNSLVHDGWWQNPEILYLANVRSADYRVVGREGKFLLLSPTMKRIDPVSYQTNYQMCKQEVLADEGYVLCAL